MSVTDIHGGPSPREIRTSDEDQSRPAPVRKDFHSILFRGPIDPTSPDRPEAPEFFHDLNLDQVVEAITAAWKEYDLAPFFYRPLEDLAAVAYRQDVMQDLEDADLMHAITVFARKMRSMRDHLDRVKKISVRYALERTFLSAVDTYCEGVQELSRILNSLDVRSRGLHLFREYLTTYVASAPFQSLCAEARILLSALSGIKYCLLIKGGAVTVRRCEGEADFSVAVEDTFAKFRRAGATEYRVELRDRSSLEVNHIQAQVLERVALLHPDTFDALGAFHAAHAGYLDETIARFDREIQFYVAYLAYVGGFRRVGLPFCRPDSRRPPRKSGASRCSISPWPASSLPKRLPWSATISS